MANTVDTMTSGGSDNPAYVTFAAVQQNMMPVGFKMLRTLLHLGCVASIPTTDGGTTTMSKDGITLAVWDAFKPLNIQTWDGIPLVYYKTWKYKDGTDNAKTAGLIATHDGDCVAFSRLLIDTLRAQGIENPDDFYVMQPNTVVKISPTLLVREWMFINNWKAIPKGTNTIVLKYNWLNTYKGAAEGDAGLARHGELDDGSFA